MKKPKKIAISLGIVWLLTLGIHVGTLPGGIPSNGTKDGYYWDEFIDGTRPHYMLGFMEVPKYQAGIPFLFTYSGGAMPASVDLALDTDRSFEGTRFPTVFGRSRTTPSKCMDSLRMEKTISWSAKTLESYIPRMVSFTRAGFTLCFGAYDKQTWRTTTLRSPCFTLTFYKIY